MSCFVLQIPRSFFYFSLNYLNQFRVVRNLFFCLFVTSGPSRDLLCSPGHGSVPGPRHTPLLWQSDAGHGRLGRRLLSRRVLDRPRPQLKGDVVLRLALDRLLRHVKDLVRDLDVVQLPPHRPATACSEKTSAFDPDAGTRLVGVKRLQGFDLTWELPSEKERPREHFKPFVGANCKRSLEISAF